MDAGVVIILLAEAALCMLILYFEGLLRRSSHVVTAAVLVVAAFGVRLACMSHVTLDYENFLAGWVQFFRENGGFRALSQSVGNYNVPYLYFLAAFSYSSMNDLYLIKLLSIFFDVMLAWGATHLPPRPRGGPVRPVQSHSWKKTRIPLGSVPPPGPSRTLRRKNSRWTSGALAISWKTPDGPCRRGDPVP